MTPERLTRIRTIYARDPIVLELCSEIERLQYPEPILDDTPLSLANDRQSLPPLKRTPRPTKETASGYTVPLCFSNVDGFTAALAGWIEMRRKKRNPPTGRAIQLLIDRVSQRPKDAIAALDMATEFGWATVKWEWFDRQNPSPVNGYTGNRAVFRGVSL